MRAARGETRLALALGLLGCASPQQARVHSTVLRAGVAAAAYEGPSAVELTRVELARGGCDGAAEYRGQNLCELLEALRTRPVRRVLSRHQSTTVNLHLELEGGLEVGFKPSRRGQEHWYRHEVLAFHLARLLGIGQVPPAVLRRIPRSALGAYAEQDELQSPPEDHDVVEGAVLFWLPELHASRFQFLQREAEWRAWLEAGAAVPREHRAEALDLATLLLFDYLQGNADRWNGANLRTDEFHRVVFRDNDNGWFLPWFEDLDWGYRRLGLSQRIPVGFRERLEAATPEALRASVLGSPDGLWHILSEQQVRAYGRRRDFVLARLGALAHLHGRDALLE